MKKIFIVLVAFVLTSCWPEFESGKIIGDFRVIKKVSQKEKTGGVDPATDHGDVYLLSSKGGTLKIPVTVTTLYLNIRVDDILPIRENKSGKLYIVKMGVKRSEVGYCKILSRTVYPDFYQFLLLTKGGDTIADKNIPASIFFNWPADSIFVKKNTIKGIYYVM